MRFTLTMAVCAVAALGVAACGSGSGGSGGSDDAPRIAFFTDALDNAYLQAGVDAAKQAAREGGAELDVISANWDSNKQIGQVQDALASGRYDAMVVEAIDGETLCKSVENAAEELVVSVYNTPLCGNYDGLYTPGTVGYFGRDEYVAGQHLGDSAAKALGGEGTVGYVSGREETGRVQTANRGIRDALAKYPDIELVATVDGQEDPARGLAAAQDIVQSHPDVDALIFYVDHMALPSIKWMQRTGQLGDRKIVTLGGTAQGFDLIRQGVIDASVMSLPREEAAYAVTAAIAALEEKPFDVPGWDARKKVWDAVSYPEVPSVITKENVDDVRAEWDI